MLAQHIFAIAPVKIKIALPKSMSARGSYYVAQQVLGVAWC